MKTKQLGVVGVDSGQVVICDPCVIDSQWDKDDEYRRDQVYDVKWLGKDMVVDMGHLIQDLGMTFDSPLEQFYGDSMNTLVKNGLAKERPAVQTGRFGYNGCCQATNSENLGGQLRYKMGHDGAGVAVSAGYGDGLYPVIAHYNDEGRVAKVEIIFIEED